MATTATLASAYLLQSGWISAGELTITTGETIYFLSEHREQQSSKLEA